MASTKKKKNNEKIRANDVSKLGPLERYNEVVNAAELKAVQLLGLSFQVEPDYFSSADKSLEYVIDNTTNNFIEEDGAGFSFISITVTSKRDDEEILSCKADYVVIYDNLSNCHEREVVVFLSRVAPFACYPYFRGLFANLDWAADTRLPPLPVHREPIVPRKKKKGETAITEDE